MKTIHIACLLTFFLLVSPASSLQRSDLSPEAQELIPEGKRVTVVLKDGKTIAGPLLAERDEDIVVRVQKTSTISMTRTILRSDIKSLQTDDVTTVFATKLKEKKLDPQKTLPEQELKRDIALFAEFLEKCRGAADYDAIRRLHADFSDELKKVVQGMEKVDGEWLTPVLAALKVFETCTKEMKELEKKPDFRSGKETQAAYQVLVDRRRDAARRLPKMMDNRLPLLIADKKFDEAVTDVNAFLGFWIGQVLTSEGSAVETIQKMNFDVILEMEKIVIDAYQKAGLGKDRPKGLKEPQDMAYVPGGYFMMGRDGSKPGENDFPFHIIYVSPFLMDKREVSNADYRKFVEYVKKTKDASMEHPDAPPLKKHEPAGWADASLNGDNQPVVGIDWFDAYAYAKWAGKRVPTEAEWEKAARGMDGRVFPWGEAAPEGLAVSFGPGRSFVAAEMDRQNPPKPRQVESGFGCSCVRKPPLPPVPTSIPCETWDVDKFLPKQAVQAVKDGLMEWKKEYVSPYGAIHMAGNAAEWVNDYYDPKSYTSSQNRDPQGPEKSDQTKFHVFRGGSFLSQNKDELAVTWRGQAAGKTLEAGCAADGRPFIGFRCVKSLDGSQPVVETKKESAPKK